LRSAVCALPFSINRDVRQFVSLRTSTRDAALIDKMNIRAEDNQTLIRAHDLARSGICRTWFDVQKCLRMKRDRA
jgi:hypothetical protein